MIKLAPSLLSADFSNLTKDIKIVENAGAQYLHLDVMDGLFVPNISFGIPVIASLRKVTDMIFDTHLMIVDPIRYIEAFAKAGADIITVHYEACDDLNAVIDKIHECGKKAGVSVKPDTDASVLFPYLDKLELVLVMTVQPGFGGQKLITSAISNIETLDQEIKKRGLTIDLEVDGGITVDNVHLLTEKGANTIVAGSSVFAKEDIAKAVTDFLKF